MLPIYYDDRLVGHVEQERVGLSFAYANQWLEAEARFAISLTMPLRADPYPADIATPWFANLLPEERQLERVGRLLGRGQGDVYGLLEEIGRDTAGALAIGGPEPADHAGYRTLGEAALADAIARLPERPLLAGEDGVTMSLAGAQSKLPVAIFDNEIMLPLNGAASTHILKPETDRLYRSVENELLCMRLAARVGLTVPPVRFGTAGNRRYLLVERYDRTIVADRRVSRGHQEDFCQALGKYPTEKYQASGGPSLADLFETLKAYARRWAADRLALLNLVIFACCIGDVDRHGKNYSLMLTDGGPRLAPGYDLMSALAYDGITKNIAMKIAGKNRAEHLQRRHWERFATEVGLSPAATVRRVRELAAAVAAHVRPVAADLVTADHVDNDAIRDLCRRIEERSNIVAANSQRGPSAAKAGTEGTSYE
jgi:serine/threonine-protein kinase HipA